MPRTTCLGSWTMLQDERFRPEFPKVGPQPEVRCAAPGSKPKTGNWENPAETWGGESQQAELDNPFITAIGSSSTTAICARRAADPNHRHQPSTITAVTFTSSAGGMNICHSRDEKWPSHRRMWGEEDRGCCQLTATYQHSS